MERHGSHHGSHHVPELPQSAQYTVSIIKAKAVELLPWPCAAVGDEIQRFQLKPLSQQL